jgi:hypothetical protein
MTVDEARGITAQDTEPTLDTPPVAGTEADTLVGSLERQRRIFAWKTGNLDAVGLRATTAASTMTLGGLVKHLALVEDDWLSQKLMGNAPAEPWADIDWDVDPDWEWRTGAEDSPEDLNALYAAAVARSRANVAQAMAEGGLGRPADFTWPDGRSPSLRRMLVDMIEEYGRHCGHADILREAVDGLVGEDPPSS